jgi:hypothetical protein
MDVETRELLLSVLDPEDLPDAFDLAELEADIADLWQRSIARLAEGHVEEWAALLVQDETGALRLFHPVVGSARSVTPDLSLPPGCTFVGTFHTHPRTDGVLPMPFSPADCVSAARDGEILSLLYSGDRLMALVRTSATAAVIDRAEAQRWYDQTVQWVWLATRNPREACWQATWILCQRYGWAWYVGRLGEPLQEEYRP